MVVTNVLVLIVTLAVAGAVGFLWRARQGRLRAVRPAAPLDPALLGQLGVVLGERGTLLQFSSAFCRPCRTTRQVLRHAAGSVPGVAHVEVDAESQLAAVRTLGISSTPTTLVLDADGRERHRAIGTPRLGQVYAVLGVPAPGPALVGPRSRRNDE